MLGTLGGHFGGWAMLIIDNKPEFMYAFSNQKEHKYRIASQQPLTPGKHEISFEFKYDGGGIGKGGVGTLNMDGKQVALGRIGQTIRARFSLDETFDVGEDTGMPVVEDYDAEMPFRFNGTLNKLTIHLEETDLADADKKAVDTGKKAALDVRE